MLFKGVLFSCKLISLLSKRFVLSIFIYSSSRLAQMLGIFTVSPWRPFGETNAWEVVVFLLFLLF